MEYERNVTSSGNVLVETEFLEMNKNEEKIASFLIDCYPSAVSLETIANVVGIKDQKVPFSFDFLFERLV